MQLILFIDSHDLLELALLSGHIGHELPVLTDELLVLPLHLVKLDALILLALSDFSQVCAKMFQALAGLRFVLLGQVLVERVFLLEQG